MIRRISIRDLKPGMHVAGRPSSPLLEAQRVYAVEGYVRSVDEVLNIARQGYREVFVDLRSALLDRGPGRGSADLDRELERLPERTAVASFSDGDPEGLRLPAEIETARALYAETLQVARQLFAQAAQGRPLDLYAASNAVDALLDGVRVNATASLWAARLQEGGARLHVHSVNVSLLAAAFGLSLGLEREFVSRIALAGLLHDLGQTRLSMELTMRHHGLTPGEHALFARHPEEGEALLQRQGGVPESVLRAVREHHEQHDGKGYPARIAGTQRSLSGRVLALADQFDQLARPGSDPWSESPARAVTLLYAGRGTVHAAEELEHFVRFVGVYPLGTMVRLSDGRVGMVWLHDPENPLGPLVNVAFDPHLRPVRSERVNLPGSGASALRVQEVIPPGQLQISPREISPLRS
ncbi:MAG: HD-GYP domain-containing protein [Desulfovibrio sp.]